MNIEYARTIHLREILSKAEIEPIEERNYRLIYKSLWSSDPEAVLWVNPETNSWYDEAEQIGGDSITLVCYYLKSIGENSTVKDALRWLKNMFGSPILIIPSSVKDHFEDDAKFKIVGEDDLNKPFLIEYLERKRGIPYDYARCLLKQYHVLDQERGKYFYALGLENEDGGVSIRTPHVKANLGLQKIKFLRGQPKPPAVHVFKDAMDYLSIMTQRNGKPYDNDVIILNGYMAMKDAGAYIAKYGYEKVYTWFDNGPVGKDVKIAFDTFLKAEPDLKYVPMNSAYRPYYDVNSCHIATFKL